MTKTCNVFDISNGITPAEALARKPLPSHFDDPHDSPGFLLWRVSNAWQREQRNALRQFGLTHTQFVALASSIATFVQHVSTAKLTALSYRATSPLLADSVAARDVQVEAHLVLPRLTILTGYVPQTI